MIRKEEDAELDALLVLPKAAHHLRGRASIALQVEEEMAAMRALGN